jgi:hypothetical protein
MSANGRLSASELTMVNGIPLGNRAAISFMAMDRDCRAATGVGVWIAAPHGGYRSLVVQGAIGGLNAGSTIVVAGAGYSTHGLGTRADIGSFPPAKNLGQYGDDGRKRRAWLLAHASNYGWTREFGEADPNHFKHDGIERNFAAPVIAPASTIKNTPAVTAPEPPQPKRIPGKKKMQTIFSIDKGGVGTMADYRTNGLTFTGQSFIQESAEAPLVWLEHPGRLEAAIAQGIPQITRSAIELRDFEIQRYGHKPTVNGPISYT